MAASDEILLTYTGSIVGEVFLRLLDADPDGGSDFVEIAKGSLFNAKRSPDGLTPVESPAVAPAMLDLDMDGRDEILVFYEGRDIASETEGVPRLSRVGYRADTQSLHAEKEYLLTDFGFPTVYEERSNRSYAIFQLVEAQLDSDPAAEFLMAYWGGEGEIIIIAAEFNSADELVILGSIADVSMVSDTDFDASAASDSARFAITAGSLDPEHGDEIVLAYVWQDLTAESGFYRKVFARVYDFVPGAENPIQFRTEIEEPDWDATSRTFDQVFSLAVAAGDFNNNGLDEIAMGCSIGSRSGGNTNYFDLGFYEFDATMTELEALQSRPYIIETTLENDLYSVTLDVGDYNYDNVDDLGWAGRRSARVFTLWRDGAYLTTGPASIGFSSTNGNSSYIHMASAVAVTDLDSDTEADLEGEVVSLAIVPDELTGGWRARVGDYDTGIGGPEEPKGALVTGDFDGDSLRMGPPTIYRRTDLGQPLMILNAPPTHFDIIDGKVYDINSCLSGDCDTSASYTLQNQLIQEVSTEVRADWAISAGMFVEGTGGINTPVAKAKSRVKLSLDAKYGEGFSRLRNSGTTIRETREFVARGDDLIYASVADYDVLEYPVYRDNEFLGTIASIVPRNPRIVTFNSKSPRAADYVTPHEPGNVLSYRPRVAIGENPLVSKEVTRSFTGFTWEMQPQGSSSWTLELSNYTSEQLTNTTQLDLSARLEFETSVEGSFPIAKFVTGSLGMSFGGYLQGDFSLSTVSTHRVEVSVDHTVAVNFGNIDAGILGSTTYEVTPYLYWSSNGALVLDYAVDPILGDGFEGWWQQKYGHAPDLAFALPWRHDVERGSNIPADQTQRTRDIVVNPTRPRAGDTVDVFARVHNYSLDPAGSPPASLRFYLDNRDGRGLIPMADENGRAELTIPGLQPRQTLNIGLVGWRVPWHVNSSARIYAVIDEPGLVAEIHENNNTGWTLLNASGGSVWPDASVLEDDWIQSKWFGWLNQAAFPFVFHLKMANLYIPENTTPGSFFFYDYAIGSWFWTTPAFWPHLYRFNGTPSGWLFYLEESSSPGRWFYDPATASWIQEGSL